MGKQTEQISTDTFFTKVPDHWSRRKGVPLAMKVIVAYLLVAWTAVRLVKKSITVQPCTRHLQNANYF